MANSDLQDLRHHILNTSVVLEGIVKARKTTVDEKIYLVLHRLNHTTLDITEMLIKRAKNDSQE